MANPNPDQRGLTPIRRGQVLNPKGRNQYTYRRDAEANLDKWCREFGDEVIERLVTDAKQGKGYAMRLVLDRILPVKHEVAVSTSHEADVEGLIEAISRAKDKMDRREAAEIEVLAVIDQPG